MSRRAFETTLEYIRDVNLAPDAASICGLVLDRTRQFGFESVLAGTMPLPGTNPLQQKSHVILNRWPVAWAERYFSRGYLFEEPTIRRVRAASRPFLWSDLESECVDDPAASRVMNEAGDFGLKHGITVAVGTLEGDIAGFSFAGGKIEVPDHAKGMIALLATYGLGRAIMLLEGRTEKMVSLSPRERDALSWAAEGKTEWEIGEILSISQHTAEKHLRSGMLKLNASNRTHAIAKAVRLGLID